MSTNWKQKSLTPQLISKDSPSYKTVEDLQYALADDAIRNIAVTGPYGSGKSSVLATLVQEAPKGKKFLDISLATLDADESLVEEQSEAPDESKHEVLNRKIEYSILQQLVYRETLETLPFSRLKKIRHFSSHAIKTIAGYLLGFAVSISLAFKPSLILADKIYDAFSIPEKMQTGISIIAIIFTLVMFYEFLKVILGRFGGMRLKNVSVGGNEINMNDESSIFNRYLDEILYFFQCTDYNVVIIEDLDRFNNTDVFLKLRELNHLINKSKIVDRNIQFIYAVKDDMFKDSSRSKFFDYITTVIPVITTSNSKDKLREALADLEHEGEISDEDIRDIAFHIDDMRLLYNIANEYHQYNNRLNTDDNHKLEARKMLAMIAVKNYHPHDFSLLHKRQGKIYEALSADAKRRYVDFAIKSRIADREALAQKNIEIFERTCHLSETELRLIYVEAIARSVTSSGVTAIEVDNQYRSFRAIAESDNLFSKLISQNSISFRYEYNYNYNRSLSTTSSSLDFKKVEKMVDPTASYSERLEKLHAGREQYEQELAEIKMEKLRVSSYSARELIMKFNIYDEEFFKQIGLSDMEEDFIRSGLIAEDYNDYISYFYPGMMSLADHQLCLDIRLNRPTSFDAQIDSPENILRELPKGAMRYKSANILSLVDYLVQNNVTWSQYYSLYVDNLIEKHPNDFLAYYCANSSYSNKLFGECTTRKPQAMWRNIGFGTTEEQEILRKQWFICCRKENIVKAQKMWCNSHYDFMASIFGNLNDEIKEHLTISFNYEHLTETSEDMLQKVVENNCYVLNAENIPLVVRVKEAKDDLSKLYDLEEIQMALQSQLLSYTWLNAKSYYDMIDCTVDDYLCRFILSGIDSLMNDSDYKDESYLPLFKSLLENSSIEDTAYKKLCDLNVFQIPFSAAIYSLPVTKLRMFVNANTADYSIDIIQQLCTIDNKIACDYLVLHRSCLLEMIESIILDTTLVQEIFRRGDFNEIELREVIKRLSTSNININKEIATKICKIQSIKYSECDDTIMAEILKNSENESAAVYAALYHIQAKENDMSIIDSDLQCIGSPYDAITETGKRVRLTRSPWVINLVQHLKECGYISSYSEEDEFIKVNTKRNK